MGFYLKDTYDFVDEGETPEPLGVWSQNRICSLHVSIFIRVMLAPDKAIYWICSCF
ncbi:DUF6402 family protein [Pantoea sp. GD03673]|uniref:DUF6402 family protein n=1 Tax=Pantoea sp. GD03673 TaxID=2975364 RepID=UPI002446C4C5|nr:DUF6402 family protein [Pantoea sp. GD03673]MDH2066234.1 DUF6402 family protein [Pantoea sp. GD03673]